MSITSIGVEILRILSSLALGWGVGSVLNYLADVLPRTRSFSAPVCAICEHKKTFFEFLFPQKCHSCQVGPQRRTWIVQIVSLILVPVLSFYPAPALGFWLSLGVFFYLALVFVIDVQHKAILHEVSLVGAILAVPFGLWLNGWQKTLIGFAIGLGVMLALYYFGILFTKWMSKARGQEIDEVALGFGDVTLSTVLGILLGSPRIIVSLFFAILLGGLMSGLYILAQMALKRYKAFTAIPYAPFLVIAAVVLIYMA